MGKNNKKKKGSKKKTSPRASPSTVPSSSPPPAAPAEEVAAALDASAALPPPPALSAAPAEPTAASSVPTTKPQARSPAAAPRRAAPRCDEEDSMGIPDPEGDRAIAAGRKIEYDSTLKPKVAAAADDDAPAVEVVPRAARRAAPRCDEEDSMGIPDPEGDKAVAEGRKIEYDSTMKPGGPKSRANIAADANREADREMMRKAAPEFVPDPLGPGETPGSQIDKAIAANDNNRGFFHSFDHCALTAKGEKIRIPDDGKRVLNPSEAWKWVFQFKDHYERKRVAVVKKVTMRADGTYLDEHCEMGLRGEMTGEARGFAQIVRRGTYKIQGNTSHAKVCFMPTEGGKVVCDNVICQGTRSEPIAADELSRYGATLCVGRKELQFRHGGPCCKEKLRTRHPNGKAPAMVEDRVPSAYGDEKKKPETEWKRDPDNSGYQAKPGELFGAGRFGSQAIPRRSILREHKKWSIVRKEKLTTYDDPMD